MEPSPSYPGANQEGWLLMVHMLATAPNLQRPLGLDLAELTRPLKEMGAQRTDKVDVRVQIDTPTGVSKRFKLTAKEPECIDVFPTKPADTLFSFVQDSIKRTNMPHRALVLWGHASGAGRGVGRVPGNVSVDRSRIGHGTCGLRRQANGAALDKAQALAKQAGGVAQAGSVWPQLCELAPAPDKTSREPPPLDLVGFDACFMSCIEVAYQLRNCVKYMLAPQAEIGLDGWHYDYLLDQIVARPDIEPDELGKALVSQVGLTHSSPQALSLLKLGALDGLVNRFTHLVDALRNAYDAPYRESEMRRWIFNAFVDSAWGGIRQFLDLADLCRLLASRIPDAEVRRAARRVMSALSNTVQDHLSVLDVPLSGLSIYSPWPRATSGMVAAGVRNISVDSREYDGVPPGATDEASKEKLPPEYPGFAFAKATKWGEFIFDPQRLQDAEHRFEAVERRDLLYAAAPASYNGSSNGHRADETKPAGRADETKPAGRADETKPAGRGDDVKAGFRNGAAAAF